MAIHIKTVTTRKDLKTFVRFANRLYKGNRYYVPSMPFDDMNTLDPKKNGAFDFSKAEYYLAYRDDELVGRVAAIINYKANEAWKVNQVRFGWFDFVDDPVFFLIADSAEIGEQFHGGFADGAMVGFSGGDL